MKIIILLISIVVFSCTGNQEKPDLPDLSQTNKIILTYKTYFDSANKIILKDVIINKLEDISAIKKTITGEPFPYLYCLSSGSMSLYKDSSLIISIVFNTSSDFRHIAFNYKNKLRSLNLSEENASLLEGFKK